jgi:hypothetical protein
MVFLDWGWRLGYSIAHKELDEQLILSFLVGILQHSLCNRRALSS